MIRGFYVCAFVALCTAPLFAQPVLGPTTETRPDDEGPRPEAPPPQDGQMVPAPSARHHQSADPAPQDVIGGLTFVDAAKVREGWSANKTLSQNITGADGETIGEVHDLVFGQDRTLRAIIVEGGGILDIGDALFRLPLEQLDLSRAPEHIRTLLKKDDIKKQGLYERPYQVDVGKGEFLGTQVFRNNVFLPQANMNVVASDIIVGRDNRVSAVLIDGNTVVDDAARRWPHYETTGGRHPASASYALAPEAVELRPTIPKRQDDRPR